MSDKFTESYVGLGWDLWMLKVAVVLSVAILVGYVAGWYHL